MSGPPSKDQLYRDLVRQLEHYVSRELSDEIAVKILGSMVSRNDYYKLKTENSELEKMLILKNERINSVLNLLEYEHDASKKLLDVVRTFQNTDTSEAHPDLAGPTAAQDVSVNLEEVTDRMLILKQDIAENENDTKETEAKLEQIKEELVQYKQQLKLDDETPTDGSQRNVLHLVPQGDSSQDEVEQITAKFQEAKTKLKQYREMITELKQENVLLKTNLKHKESYLKRMKFMKNVPLSVTLEDGSVVPMQPNRDKQEDKVSQICPTCHYAASAILVCSYCRNPLNKQ